MQALHSPVDLARHVATHTTPQRRPSLRQPVVRELAARALAERLGGEPAEIQALAAALAVIIRHRRTGAEIAEVLATQHGRAPDGEAVAVLDDATYEMLLAHDRLVAAWVAHHDIRPALTCGAVIRVETNDRAWNRVEVEGEIVGIDAVHARYHVFSAALGHDPAGPGPHSRPIPFEDVRPVDAIRAAA